MARMAAALVLLCLMQPAAAQPVAEPSLEVAVKAAFLPKFARYVRWPSESAPQPGKPVELCIIGSDPFGQAIDDAVAGQQVGQHPVVVRRLPSADGAAACHIAFVRGVRARSTSRLLAALRGLPVLTVTDSRAGPPRGMIHFAIARGRVGFHVDAAAAAGSGLSISSRLLDIALSVKEAG